MAQGNRIAAFAAKCISAMLIGTVLLTGCGTEKVPEVDVETLEKENAGRTEKGSI